MGFGEWECQTSRQRNKADFKTLEQVAPQKAGLRTCCWHDWVWCFKASWENLPLSRRFINTSEAFPRYRSGKQNLSRARDSRQRPELPQSSIFHSQSRFRVLETLACPRTLNLGNLQTLESTHLATIRPLSTQSGRTSVRSTAFP